MTRTMLGELSRLFAAEARDVRQTVGATAIEHGANRGSYNSAHRLSQISAELRARQASMGLLDSIGTQPVGAGLYGTQPVQDAAGSVTQSVPTPNVSIPGLLSTIQQPISQAGAQAQGAGQQAQTASQQAQQASSQLQTAVILAVAVGLGIFFITRGR